MKLLSPGMVALAASAVALPVAVIVASPQSRADGDLKTVAQFEAIADPAARSVAIFAEMGKVLTHPRCVNCHPRGDRPLQGDAMAAHNPPVIRGTAEGKGAPGMECATCHGPRNANFVNGEGSMPGHPLWHLAPRSMAWQGMSLRQICEQIKDRRRNGGKTLDQLIEHNGTDTLVGWAWNPGRGRTPAPGTQAEFGALTKAWVETGARCPG